MVWGTPLQLRTFPATRSSETGRVFIQDSSCCRLPQHYLWGFHGQPLQGKGSLCSSGWGEQYSLASLSSLQASGQPGSTEVLTTLEKSRLVKRLCSLVVLSHWSGPLDMMQAKDVQDLVWALVRSMAEHKIWEVTEAEYSPFSLTILS